MIVPLSRLSAGVEARVVEVAGSGALKRRLLDLGFTPGAAVRVIRTGPLGGPTAYLVRGAVIALRAAGAATVLVAADPGAGGTAS